MHAFALLIDHKGVLAKVRAQNGRQPPPARLVAILCALGRGGDARAAIHGQEEAHIGPRQRQPLDDIGDGGAFRTLGLEKFQARGRGVEEIAHLHPRAATAQRGGGARAGFRSAFDRKLPGAAQLLILGGDVEARDRTDGGQGLAAKAHGMDVQKIVLPVLTHGQFGGGVPLDRGFEPFGVHARAVILDDDAGQPAALDADVDALRACIERVLHQLLDGAGGALDHFAGGDAVDGFR